MSGREKGKERLHVLLQCTAVLRGGTEGPAKRLRGSGVSEEGQQELSET